MNCEKYSEWISLYIDGELEEKNRAVFENHLKSCESCSEEVRFLREIMNDLKELEMIDLPEEFHKDLMAKIQVTSMKVEGRVIPLPINKRKWYTNMKVVSAVAAVFIFSTVLINLPKVNMPVESVSETNNDLMEARMAEPPTDVLIDEQANMTENKIVGVPVEAPKEQVRDAQRDKVKTSRSDIILESPVNKPEKASIDIPEELARQSRGDAVDSKIKKSDQSPTTLIEPALEPDIKPSENIKSELDTDKTVFNIEKEPGPVEEDIKTWLVKTDKFNQEKETIMNAANGLGLEVSIIEELGSAELGTQNITIELKLEQKQLEELESQLKGIKKTVSVQNKKQDEKEQEPKDIVKLLIVVNQLNESSKEQ